MPNETRQQWTEERTAVLAESADPPDLELAATELALSDDPAALDALGKFLASRDFLERLDPDEDGAGKTIYFSRVMKHLKDRPSPEVERLCLSLVDDPLYLEHDRKSFLLEAMARVVPMSEQSVEAFRRANEQDYFAFDALLLAGNGSPLALELFRSMMGNAEIDVETRIELLHKGIVPYRNRLGTLQMVAAIMSSDLEQPLILAAIESVFDYQREWFTMHGPMPPGWRTASVDVLRFVVELAAHAKARPDLPAELAKAIDDTTGTVRALLDRRSV